MSDELANEGAEAHLETVARQSAELVAMMEGSLKALEARSGELLASLRLAAHEQRADSAKALSEMQKISQRAAEMQKALSDQIKKMDDEWPLDLRNTAAEAGQAHAVAVAGTLAGKLAEQTRPHHERMTTAAAAMNAAARRLAWKTTLVSAAAGAGIAVAVALMTYWWVPSLDEIASRRAEVATLEKQLSGIDLANCGPKDQYRCVRVNKQLGPQGALKDYYVVATR
jgi:hypothetical protein